MKEILIALIYALTYFLPVVFLLFLLLCLRWHNDPILFRDKVKAPWYASIFGRRSLQRAIDEHYYDYRTMPFDTFLTLYRSNPEKWYLDKHHTWYSKGYACGSTNIFFTGRDFRRYCRWAKPILAAKKRDYDAWLAGEQRKKDIANLEDMLETSRKWQEDINQSAAYANEKISAAQAENKRCVDNIAADLGKVPTAPLSIFEGQRFEDISSYLKSVTGG